MSASNSFTLIGNATRDPETKQVGADNSVTEISVAWNDRLSKKEDAVSFFDCSAWGKLGEVIAKYVRKGDKVCFRGEMIQDRWKDKEGNNRSKIQMRVQDMELLPNKRDNRDAEQPGKSAPDKTIPDDEEIPF